MKRRLRLRGRRDFQALVSGRRVFAGAGLIGFARPGATDGTRVGIAVSRRVKGSVARNRARRRLREAARLGFLPGLSDWAEARPGITLDVVLIARPAALDLPFESLLSEASEFARRLAAAGLVGPHR
jgi:ribonuclease P protein component